MRPVPPAEDAAHLPVALVAVTVAGQCRERSPADILLFGEEATRFADRFADPDHGRALLAAAISDGAAETMAEVRTGTGSGPFRVSLWRQRGGGRIRIVGAFVPGRKRQGCLPPAGPDPVPDPAADALSGPGPDPAGDVPDAGPPGPVAPLVRLGHDLRSPVDAVMGLAQRLRSEAGAGETALLRGYASDFLAAAWRMRRIAEDLAVLAEQDGEEAPHPHVSEVDLGRLARRILRLVRPAAEAQGVRLVFAGPEPHEAAMVMADDGALWSALDNLLRHALRLAAPGSEIRVEVGAPDAAGRLAVAVTATREDGAGEAAPRGLELPVAAEMGDAAGGRLEVQTPGPRFLARIVFPAERCLAEP